MPRCPGGACPHRAHCPIASCCSRVPWPTCWLPALCPAPTPLERDQLLHKRGKPTGQGSTPQCATHVENICGTSGPGSFCLHSPIARGLTSRSPCGSDGEQGLGHPSAESSLISAGPGPSGSLPNSRGDVHSLSLAKVSHVATPPAKGVEKRSLCNGRISTENSQFRH